MGWMSSMLEVNNAQINKQVAEAIDKREKQEAIDKRKKFLQQQFQNNIWLSK